MIDDDDSTAAPTRPSPWLGRFYWVDPGRCGGAPCLSGTRVTLYTLIERFVAEFPDQWSEVCADFCVDPEAALEAFGHLSDDIADRAEVFSGLLKLIPAWADQDD